MKNQKASIYQMLRSRKFPPRGVFPPARGRIRRRSVSICYLPVVLCLCGLFTTACGNDDETPDTGERIEELALTPGWNNYLVAATSELLDDCIALWAAWNGPEGLSDEEWERLGRDFFTANASQIGADGYAKLFSSAGPGNHVFNSEPHAVQMIVDDGCIGIADEVGEQKIATPYSFAEAGNTAQAVLEVESWYSWNSIRDFSDNIVSIRNSYRGAYPSGDAGAGSISAFVGSRDAGLDGEVTAAIDAAYNAVAGMKAPFRSYPDDAGAKSAMDACADLSDVLKRILPLLEGAGDDFTPILETYANSVVVPTYRDMKDAAHALYRAAVAYNGNPTQGSLDRVCEAWRENRIPWEQSEAFLFGPADVLGLDPSLDSWPLDQNDIWGILNDINSGKYTTVDQIRAAIRKDEVRGFHAVELLLFRDGSNRTAGSR